MPQPARPMHVPAGLPIDESTRPELLDVGQANLSNVNVRQDNRGGLTKRLGYAALSKTYLDASTRSTGRRLFMNGDTLCVIDGTKVDVYSDTLARNVPTKGRVSEASVKLREAPSLGSFSIIEDAAFANGYIVLSYIVAASVNAISGAVTGAHAAVVVDASSGAVLRIPEGVDSSSDLKDCRLASYGKYVIAFTCDNFASEVRARYLDTTSAATISTGWQVLATFSDFNTGFDCANCASNDRVAIAFGADSSSAQRITVKTLNIAGQIETVNVPVGVALGATNASGVGLSESGATLWLAYYDGQAAKVIGFNPSDIDGTPFASVYTATTLGGSLTTTCIHVAETGSGTCNVYATGSDGTSFASGYEMDVCPVMTTAGAAVSGGAVFPLGGNLIKSRPFVRSGRVYAHFDSSGTGGEGVLCDCTYPSATEDFYLRPVAVAVPRPLSGGSFYRRGRTAAIDSTRYVAPASIVQGGNTSGARMVEYDFGDPQRWQTAELGGSTYIGSGVLAAFDGECVYEAAFQVAPTKPQTQNNTGTGLTLTNGRRYVATFEHVDADGKWHVSGVSLPCAISGAQANKALRVRVPPCVITSRGYATTALYSSLRAVLYATLDANNGQPPYYRAGAVRNDPYSTVLSFTDTLTDADLAIQSQLYGTGNLPGTGAGQDHRAPAGCTHVVAYNGMLVGAAGKTIVFSSQPIDGEGQWFSPLFTAAVDDDITALAVQDGTLYAFTHRGIYSASGDPPSDNGASGGIGTPRRLATDIGCTNARSVLVTALGIFFQSDRGIELLNRGGAVEFVGSALQTTLASLPIVSSAVLDSRDSNSFARFTVAASQTDAVSGNGRDLIFDLTSRSWVSVDTKHGSADAEPSQDAANVFVNHVWRYGWLGTDGTVYYEHLAADSTAHLDGSTWIDESYEIPSWKLGLQQEQRVYEVEALFEQHSAGGLAIDIAHDFGAYNAEEPAKVWTEAAVLGKRRVTFRPKPRGAAVGFRVRGTAPAVYGTGKGFTFVGLTSDISPIQGATRGTPRIATGLRR